LDRDSILFAQNAKEQMLRTDAPVFGPERLFRSKLENTLETGVQCHFPRAETAETANADMRFDLVSDPAGISAKML